MNAPIEPISREDIEATLADLKQMWSAMCDLVKTIPGAGPVLSAPDRATIRHDGPA